MDDVKRLLSIIKAAPIPFDKNDSRLAQEYRNWFFGVRSERLKAAEQSFALDAAQPSDVERCSACGEYIKHVCLAE